MSHNVFNIVFHVTPGKPKGILLAADSDYESNCFFASATIAQIPGTKFYFEGMELDNFRDESEMGLCMFLEALPDVLVGLSRGLPRRIELYEQGWNRGIDFFPTNEKVLIRKVKYLQAGHQFNEEILGEETWCLSELMKLLEGIATQVLSSLKEIDYPEDKVRILEIGLTS